MQLSFFSAISLSVAAYGQSSHGSITGILSDTAGGAIYGAQVRLLPADVQMITNRQAPIHSPMSLQGQVAHVDAVPQIKLDVIPSDLVESVEIRPTLSLFGIGPLSILR